LAKGKTKSKAKILTADGTGGMTEVQDRRFEARDWLVDFVVPTEQADDWFEYFTAECQNSGWNSSGIRQIDAKENSGSLTIHAGGVAQELALVWERKRNGPIKIRAKSCGSAQLPLDEINGFFPTGESA
jgi:hypothetical protein